MIILLNDYRENIIKYYKYYKILYVNIIKIDIPSDQIKSNIIDKILNINIIINNNLKILFPIKIFVFLTIYNCRWVKIYIHIVLFVNF